MSTTTRRRIKAVRLQVGIELPDQRSYTLLAGALLVGEGVELMDKPLGVDPTQCVAADVELPGVIADRAPSRQVGWGPEDHRIAQELVRVNAAP